VTPEETSQLLRKFKAGEVSEDEVLNNFRAEPIDNLGFAKVMPREPFVRVFQR
jgi:hypothetical protein